MNETLLTRAEESIQHGLALLLMSSYGITEAEAKQTVTRIADMIQHSDEPRFSLYDYVDALANWNDPLDIRALMKLDDTKFFMAVVAAAEHKRSIYATDYQEVGQSGLDILSNLKYGDVLEDETSHTGILHKMVDMKEKASIISGGLYLDWADVDTSLGEWAKDKFANGCDAWGERDETSFLVDLSFSLPIDKAKEEILVLYEKYDAEKNYEPDMDGKREILPGAVALGVMNEVFASTFPGFCTRSAVATYSGVIFLADKIERIS